MHHDLQKDLERSIKKRKIKPNEEWEREWKAGKTPPIKAGKIIEHK